MSFLFGCISLFLYPCVLVNCIEYGYHWLGNTNLVDDNKIAKSADKCKALCSVKMGQNGLLGELMGTRIGVGLITEEL